MKSITVNVYNLVKDRKNGGYKYTISDWIADIPYNAIDGDIISLHCGYGRFRDHIITTVNGKLSVVHL